MVKREIAGVAVPEVATNEQLREFVYAVYDEYGSNYLAAGAALDVSPATVWKLINQEQGDSPIIREKWGIRKTPKRPRVWMPTNNLQKAMDVFRKHYPEVRRIDYHDRSSQRLSGRSPLSESSLLQRNVQEQGRQGPLPESPD